MTHISLKRTVRVLSAFTLCIILTGSVLPAMPRTTPQNLPRQVDTYITALMQSLPIPGLAVGIVQDDQVLYLQGYGTANVDGDPVTPQTPFMLASVTKTFTALGVQQLAQAGKINLDAHVQTYIPEFCLNDEYDGATVTVRHLLEHTSGISTMEGNQPYLQSPNAVFEDALKQLARYRPNDEPGESYEYSNWNYALLGEVITRASGQPYVEYMQANVLDALEMSRASYADSHTLPGAATGHLIVLGLPIPYDEKSRPAALSAGYLSASAEDMTHYLIAFLNQGRYHGKNLLSSAGEGWYDMYWNWLPGHPGDLNYSFSGGHNSINTNIQLFPLQRVGVVVLMNTRLDQLIPGPTVNEIAFNLARLTIGASYEVPSNRGFYGGYLALGVLLLLSLITILRQILHLNTWSRRYRNASTGQRIALWLGILVQLLISISLFLAPAVFDSRWNIVLFFRPDFSIPVLLVSSCLAMLGTIKIVLSLRRTKIEGSV